MHKKPPIIGEQFESLVVVEYWRETRSWKCRCQCNCGGVADVWISNLRNRHTQSCGCLRKRRTKEANTRHGLRRHPLYAVRNTMLARCYNPNHRGYSHYGGRGIQVCPEWRQSFVTFYDWAIAQGWRQGLTVDRRDNDGDYTPENARIVDWHEQENNRSNNHHLSAFGETKTIAQWSRDARCVVAPKTFETRLALGWTVEQALTQKAGLNYVGKIQANA